MTAVAVKIKKTKLPDSPGIYLMKDGVGRVLYVGKAANLRRRVSSYFARAHDARIENLLSKVGKIEFKKTDTALEALILESRLIKKFRPPFNIREKDDKSFLYVEITCENFPHVLLARGSSLPTPPKSASGGRRPGAKSYGGQGKVGVSSKFYGPFTSAASIREALKILRRIFPWSTHQVALSAKRQALSVRPCFDYEIGLCPGTCIGAIPKAEYRKNIAKLKLFFEGKKQRIIRELQKEMKSASRKLEFEKAGKLRRQIFALKHIQDTALISDSVLPTTCHLPPTRIEGYDVSNISGTSAVGSMVVFKGNEPDKNEYRKFKIRTIIGSDDTGMLKEVLRRRFQHPGWPLPNVVLVDGGRGQVNAAKSVLAELGLKIPVVGIAKGTKRKKNEFIGAVPEGVSKATLIKVRDEAHRFAIGYHKKVRARQFLGNV